MLIGGGMPIIGPTGGMWAAHAGIPGGFLPSSLGLPSFFSS